MKHTRLRSMGLASFASMFLAMQAAEAAPACPNGMEKGTDTAGHCCYPGQAWAGTKCVGLPMVCPAGMSINVTNQTCEVEACTDGKTRTADGVHCCFKGQAWSTSQQACIGRVTECPKGTEASGDTCVTDDRDGDGIPNGVDQCPDQAEDKNGFEDSDGCPDEPKRLEAAAAAGVAAEQEKQRQAAAAQKIADEEKQKQNAVAQKQAAEQAQRDAASRNWNDQYNTAFQVRAWSYACMIIGGGMWIGTGVSLGLGAANNGTIRDGGFSKASDISSAASDGATLNAIAVGTAIGGAVLVGLGVLLRVTATPYPEPLHRGSLFKPKFQGPGSVSFSW